MFRATGWINGKLITFHQEKKRTTKRITFLIIKVLQNRRKLSSLLASSRKYARWVSRYRIWQKIFIINKWIRSDFSNIHFFSKIEKIIFQISLTHTNGFPYFLYNMSLFDKYGKFHVARLWNYVKENR
jgi:hypothetical protein